MQAQLVISALAIGLSVGTLASVGLPRLAKPDERPRSTAALQVQPEAEQQNVNRRRLATSQDGEPSQPASQRQQAGFAPAPPAATELPRQTEQPTQAQTSAQPRDQDGPSLRFDPGTEEPRARPQTADRRVQPNLGAAQDQTGYSAGSGYRGYGDAYGDRYGQQRREAWPAYGGGYRYDRGNSGRGYGGGW